ncbi:MAG: dephospho-CoA kinase [Nitrospirota bacterium]|nr:dephospho-CoA kinase [Nitrospirota bacterium]MDE3035445.1 dephospho-CoA kinase [Nitrospirota bacterium]MDE3119359.1 dephospho-CoA kinase [Nitrospirota bacterium]MDE3243143.1 dephospho-CoA kinase [Nitrospirota bacterium]
MILVGLTGGLATGKSSVARLFQDNGAYVIDADELARQVVQPGKPAWRDIARTFGAKALNPDRTLNRAALADAIFRNEAKRRRLNAIVHPRVAREQARLTRAIAQKDPGAIIVYDVPLLFEAGVDKRVDKIIVVTADRATQIRRLMTRNGFTRAEAVRRLRAQMPLRAKIARADEVIDGTLSFAQTKSEVERIVSQLKSLA